MVVFVCELPLHRFSLSSHGNVFRISFIELHAERSNVCVSFSYHNMILGAAEGWYLAKMVVSYGYAPSTSMKQFGIVFIFAFPYFIYTHSRSGDS